MSKAKFKTFGNLYIDTSLVGGFYSRSDILYGDEYPTYSVIVLLKSGDHVQALSTLNESAKEKMIFELQKEFCYV